MGLSIDKIKEIHLKRKAVHNRIYKSIDGKTYIGNKYHTLDLLPVDNTLSQNGYKFRYITQSDALTLDDVAIECSGVITLALPNLNVVPSDKVYSILNSGSDTVTLEGFNSQLIYDVGTFNIYPSESLVIYPAFNKWGVQ